MVLVIEECLPLMVILEETFDQTESILDFAFGLALVLSGKIQALYQTLEVALHTLAFLPQPA